MAHREALKCLVTRQEVRDSFHLDRKVVRDHCPFSEPSPYISEIPSTSLTLFVSPWGSLKTLLSTQFMGPPKLLTVIFPYEWLVLAHASQLPKSYQIRNKPASISPQAVYLLVNDPRPSTSSSQPWFTAWNHLGTSKPSTSSSHLQIALKLVLCAPGQNGWSWMYQQQSRLNCNRRVYTAHTVGVPWVPSLGNRGGCATGPYRTHTTLCHSTKPGRHSSNLIHRNKHREAVKIRWQRNMAQMKVQNKTPEKKLHKMERSHLQMQNSKHWL